MAQRRADLVCFENASKCYLHRNASFGFETMTIVDKPCARHAGRCIGSPILDRNPRKTEAHRSGNGFSRHNCIKHPPREGSVGVAPSRINHSQRPFPPPVATRATFPGHGFPVQKRNMTLIMKIELNIYAVASKTVHPGHAGGAMKGGNLCKG